MPDPREIAPELPEEPPPGSVVLTHSGLAFQRESASIRSFNGLLSSTLPARWWHCRDAGSPVSWPFLLASGPLLLLTDDATREWLDAQNGTREEATR